MPADSFFQRHRIAVLLGSFLAPLVTCAVRVACLLADQVGAALALEGR